MKPGTYMWSETGYFLVSPRASYHGEKVLTNDKIVYKVVRKITSFSQEKNKIDVFLYEIHSTWLYMDHLVPHVKK